MNLVLSLGIGVLVMLGTYQLLGRELFRAPFGIYLLLNAANLLIASMAASLARAAPLAQLTSEAPADTARVSADPLVQAMVLTAIIIGFGVSTFILLLTGRLARREGSLDMKEIRHWRR
jgi:multicomponent Na+:H+ antiporter subunit C